MVEGLVGLALLGGALALDATSVGQFMISRPLVAGLAAGVVVGDPGTGLVVGALLEVYLLVAFPTGGARFPEGATATVVAVGAAAAATGEGAIPLGMAGGLVWGQVGEWSVTAQRRLNGRLVPESDTPGATPARLESAHLAAVAIDFVRGVGVTALGLAAVGAAVTRVAPAWPLDGPQSMGILVTGAAVSLGIMLRSLGGFRRRAVLFAIGLAVGAVGGWFL